MYSAATENIEKSIIDYRSHFSREFKDLNNKIEYFKVINKAVRLKEEAIAQGYSSFNSRSSDLKCIEEEKNEIAALIKYIDNSIEDYRRKISNFIDDIENLKQHFRETEYNFRDNEKFISILAYNINGLKNKSDMFFDFIKLETEIFILIETHVEEKDAHLFVDKFSDFDISWQYAKRENPFGRASGGVVCGVKKSLKNIGVKHEFKSHANINHAISCHLTINHFKFTLIPVYLRAGNNWEVEFSLLKFLLKEPDTFNHLLMGDFNIRIGREQQHNLKKIYYAVHEKRNSKDYTSHINSKYFLEFLAEYNLTILNGRTKGDEEGEITSVANDGKSIVDFCCIHSNLLDMVKELVVDKSVLEFYTQTKDKRSDHFPIKLRLSLNKIQTICID